MLYIWKPLEIRNLVKSNQTCFVVLSVSYHVRLCHINNCHNVVWICITIQLHVYTWYTYTCMRVPMHPGKPVKITFIFQVLKFYQIWKCPGKNIPCEKIHLEQKTMNTYYVCKRKLRFRRKRVLIHILGIPC